MITLGCPLDFNMLVRVVNAVSRGDGDPDAIVVAREDLGVKWSYMLCWEPCVDGPALETIDIGSE